MNIDVLGKFYLGNGGIGDFLLFLSSFYDDVESANIIFLANKPSEIKLLSNHFPKLSKKLILTNNFELMKEFYPHKNCIGTGIIPKDLDYNNWYKVNIFDEYKIKQFPNFVNLFRPKRKFEKQIFIQKSGSTIEGIQKQRIIKDSTIELIKKEFCDYTFISLEDLKDESYDEIFSLIRGSDIVIGVDSFVKTFSAQSKIKTIVYDNIYSPEYLKNFRDNIDYGHYVFLYNWDYITLKSQ